MGVDEMKYMEMLLYENQSLFLTHVLALSVG